MYIERSVMKMSQLLELARADNPMLVEYTKRWVQTRNPSLKEEAKLPDPVTAARAWNKKNGNIFLGFLFVSVALVLCGCIGTNLKEGTSAFEWFRLFVFLLCVASLILVVRGFCWICFCEPEDTKKFMKAITLL